MKVVTTYSAKMLQNIRENFAANLQNAKIQHYLMCRIATIIKFNTMICQLLHVILVVRFFCGSQNSFSKFFSYLQIIGIHATGFMVQTCLDAIAQPLSCTLKKNRLIFFGCAMVFLTATMEEMKEIAFVEKMNFSATNVQERKLAKMGSLTTDAFIHRKLVMENQIALMEEMRLINRILGKTLH